MTNSMNLWGRDFSLPVYYECNSDQDVLDIQKEAKDALLASWDTVEDSKEAIEDYCLERDDDQIEGPITNIFRYVIPTSIVVLRSDDTRKAALMCNYRFDPEHGLAAVFENEKLRPSSPKTSSRSIIRRQKNENRGRSSTHQSGLGLFYVCSAR